jgi:sigma-B regulation protein RsbU (phosphoserine phosphatase)
MDDFEYGAAHVVMEPGDVLLLYTDGVTEAFNAAREEYSEERLMRAAAAAPDPTPQALLQHVLADVRSFTDGAPQSDDLTMLALRYRG